MTEAEMYDEIIRKKADIKRMENSLIKLIGIEKYLELISQYQNKGKNKWQT